MGSAQCAAQGLEALLMLHHLGFQTSKGTEDYLYYFLLVVLTPINCFLNGTLLSLSAFLTGIIMNQHHLVQNSHLAECYFCSDDAVG